jgi:hypothetical protein
MAKQSVTTHKRTMRNGTTVTVHQHKRRGPNPGGAWRSVRRGWKHQRHGNPGRAVAWAGAAVLEFGAWALFGVTGVVLLTFALLAGALGTRLIAATRGDRT